MTTTKKSKAQSIREIVGFGAGCLLGGLVGALAGLRWQSELAVMVSYAVGLAGGGLGGAWLTRRWFPVRPPVDAD